METDSQKFNPVIYRRSQGVGSIPGCSFSSGRRETLGPGAPFSPTRIVSGKFPPFVRELLPPAVLSKISRSQFRARWPGYRFPKRNKAVSRSALHRARRIVRRRRFKKKEKKKKNSPAARSTALHFGPSPPHPSPYRHRSHRVARRNTASLSRPQITFRLYSRPIGSSSPRIPRNSPGISEPLFPFQR